MTLVAELDFEPDETVAGTEHGAGGAETEFLEPLETSLAVPRAWEFDDGDEAVVRPWGDAWRHAGILVLGGVLVAAFALAVFIARDKRSDNQTKPIPTTTTAVPAPAAPLLPPVPRLDGTYRIFNDWDHQTYRDTTGSGWTHEGQAQTVVWAFATTCSAQNDCVATGVELDDTNHQKVGTVDSLKLVNGIWQDMTPAHIQIGCTINGKVNSQVWSTLGWSFEPLPDGTFHGELTTTMDTDSECGAKGDTGIVPITATRLGPAPAGVLTGAPPASTAAIPAAPHVRSTTSAPPRSAAPAARPVDPDQRYLEALNASGVGITDVGAVIKGAHEICASLADGQSKTSIEADLMAGNKTLTEGNAATVVNSAAAVYCPQNG